VIREDVRICGCTPQPILSRLTDRTASDEPFSSALALPGYAWARRAHCAQRGDTTWRHYAFTNTLSEAESLAAYERYHVPAPGSWVRGGCSPTSHRATRTPLLFIAGGKDDILPPSVNEPNVHHYRKSSAITDCKEFPGRSHFTVGQEGWEEVADYALDWAKEHAALAARRAD
jgi:pimeloyl-ACP methyl ester carboxylesterase